MTWVRSGLPNFSQANLVVLDLPPHTAHFWLPAQGFPSATASSPTVLVFRPGSLVLWDSSIFSSLHAFTCRKMGYSQRSGFRHTRIQTVWHIAWPFLLLFHEAWAAQTHLGLFQRKMANAFSFSPIHHQNQKAVFFGASWNTPRSRGIHCHPSTIQFQSSLFWVLSSSFGLKCF